MQYFGVTRCPYCKKRVNIIRTWSLKKQGEYICPRCNGISNIYLSPLIYIFAVIALFSAAALYFFHKFILDDIVPQIGIQIIVPFVLFFLLSLFTVYLEKPVIKKSKISKKEARAIEIAEDKRRAAEIDKKTQRKESVHEPLKLQSTRPKPSKTGESEASLKGVRPLPIEGQSLSHQAEGQRPVPRSTTQMQPLNRQQVTPVQKSSSKQNATPQQNHNQAQRGTSAQRDNRAKINPEQAQNMTLKGSQAPARRREALFDDEVELSSKRGESQTGVAPQKKSVSPAREQRRAEIPTRRARDRSEIPVRKDDTEAFLVKEVMSKYDDKDYINQRIKEIETGENKTYRNIR